MIPNNALQRVRALIVDDLENGEAGTGTTIPTVSDTSLQTRVAATETALTTISAGNGFNTTLLIPTGTANGNTLTEFADFINSGSTMLSRVVVSGIAKTSGKEISKITNYTVQRG